MSENRNRLNLTATNNPNGRYGPVDGNPKHSVWLNGKLTLMGAGEWDVKPEQEARVLAGEISRNTTPNSTVPATSIPLENPWDIDSAPKTTDPVGLGERALSFRELAGLVQLTNARITNGSRVDLGSS